jgi:hypothetical protein
MMKALETAQPDATEKIAALIKSVVNSADDGDDAPSKTEGSTDAIKVPPKSADLSLAKIAEQFLGTLNEKKSTPPNGDTL